MTNRPTPHSNTWTPSTLTTLLFTPTKRLSCTCKDNTTLFIPEILLCHYSRYYTVLLRGSFAEAGSNSITLELSGQQAKVFVTWLYSGRFGEEVGYEVLFELYVFADKVDVPALKKDIMSFIHKRNRRKGSPDVRLASRVFHMLPKSCGLVRWMLDRFARHEGFDLAMDPEFGIGVLAARGMAAEYICRGTNVSVGADPCCNIIKRLRCECSSRCWDKAKKGEACAYHEHASPEEWKVCAGDDFQHVVDLAYLKGTTVHDTLPEERFARFDRYNESRGYELCNFPRRESTICVRQKEMLEEGITRGLGLTNHRSVTTLNYLDRPRKKERSFMRS